MDWEQLREKTLAQVGTALVTEGAGTAGGFVGAAFIGRQVQNLLGQSDEGVKASGYSLVNGTLAWVTNNAPKALIWYFTRKYAIEPGETVTPSKEVISDARKALAGSIVFDTLMRLSNAGTNPASAKPFGFELLGSGNGTSPEAQKSMQADVQRLIQENSALRAELNKALQRLATPPAAPPVQVHAPAPVQVQAPPVQVQAPPVQVQAPAPVVQAPPVQPAPVTHVVPAPAPVAPVVQAQPITPQQPPVIRYQPVAPPAAPVVRPAPVAQPTRPAPIVAKEVTPYVQQPVPPAVSERERKYGFMREAVSPPAVQEREKKYGFMRGGEEKEIAAMFGML